MSRLKYLHDRWHTLLSQWPFMARQVATLWGETKYRVLGLQRNNLIKNLTAAFPNKTEHEIKTLSRKIFITTEQDRAEQFRLAVLNDEKMRVALSRIELRGSDHVEEAYRQNRPVILVTPHYGNFMLGALRVATDFSGNGVYFFYNPPERNPYAKKGNRLLDRPDNNCHKIYNNSHGIKTALKALKNKGTLCMLPDLISVTTSAIYVPFFGRFFTAMSGIAFLAERSNAVVIPAYCYSKPGGGYILQFTPVLLPANDSSLTVADRAYDLTSRLFQELERQISLHPEHWRYWHIFIKRSIATPTPPKSLSDLIIQLKSSDVLIDSDEELWEVVKQWLSQIEGREAMTG